MCTAAEGSYVLGAQLVLPFQIDVTELGMKILCFPVIFLSFSYLFLILR